MTLPQRAWMFAAMGLLVGLLLGLSAGVRVNVNDADTVTVILCIGSNHAGD